MKKGSKGKKTLMSPSVHLFCYQPLYFAPGNKTHMSFCNFGDLGALSNKKNSLLIFDQSSLKEGKNNGRVHFQGSRFSVAPSLRLHKGLRFDHITCIGSLSQPYHKDALALSAPKQLELSFKILDTPNIH